MPWRFYWNLLRGLPEGCGIPLPEGFLVPQQSIPYLRGAWKRDEDGKILGERGERGIRFKAGPFHFESYVSDVEPKIEPGVGTRLVLWQQLTRTDVPTGWHRPWFHMNMRQYGIASIDQPEKYWENWSSHARRHKRKAERDDRFAYEIVSLDEFCDAYNATGKLKWLRQDMINVLERRSARTPENVILFGAREKSSGRLLGGLAVVDLPDISSSVHTIAYLHRDAQRTSIGYGLIDEWYKHSIAHGIKFLNYGLVWYPGDPRGWKHYSDFKRQFDLHLWVCPNALIKIAH